MQEEVWYNNAVIKPPEFEYEENRYPRHVVDSKDRDVSVHPTPSAYNIPLQDDIEDIVIAELISCDVPFSGYLVNSYHNSFSFKFPSSSIYEVTLDDGDYSASELATEIQSKMNSVSSGFSVSYISKIGKLVFSHTTSDFTISFASKNAQSFAHVLGFSPQKTYTSTSRSLKTANKVNLEYYKYMVMYIDQFTSNKGSNDTVNNSFAVLYESQSTNNIRNDSNVLKKFTPPLARLQRLNISFYDRDGNPYDFNGVDHSFELLFTSFKQKRKYNSMSFAR